jgi:hypothetical protein
MVDADRPETHLNLGLLDLRRREQSTDRDEHIRHEPCTCGEHRARLLFSCARKPIVLGAMELRMVALGFGWAGAYDLRDPSAVDQRRPPRSQV